MQDICIIMFMKKIFTSLGNAFSSLYGKDIRLLRTFKLNGGDINKAYGIELSNGIDVFMKANEKQKVDMFICEQENLLAISSTNSIAIPNILAVGTDDGEEVGYSFLLMEYVPEVEKPSDFWENFGNDLANMHKADTSAFVDGKKFGFLKDNYIGNTKQINTPNDSWVEFFKINRLLPQFNLAKKYFDEEYIKKFDILLDRCDEVLIEPIKPSLVHGDLWSGNVLCGKNPQSKDDLKKVGAVLIDGACYVGHCEVDIAMSELFGGFESKFYESYKKNGLLQEGYSKRRDIYNLYHVLNHLNIFGTTYLSAAKTIIDKYTN